MTEDPNPASTGKPAGRPPRVPAWLKWMLAGLVLVLAAPLLLALFLDQEHYKLQISDAVEARTGRPLSIEGALTLAYGMKPRIVARDIRYPNASWGRAPWAVEVDEAAFAVDLWALLQGKVRVEDIVLEGPRLRVEKNEAGVYNLAFARSPSGQASRALPGWLDISGAEIVNGEISVDAYNRRHWDIHIERAQAVSDGPDAPITLDFRGEVERTPVTARATLGSLAAVYARRSSPLVVDGHVGAPENRLTATGSARNLLLWRGVDLQLEFTASRLAGLSELAGVRVPDIGRVSGRATFHQPGNIATMQLREIEAISAEFGLHSALSGEIRKLFSLREIDLRLGIAGSPAYPLAGSSPLEASANATLRGSARNLRLAVETAKAQSAELSITARGEIGLVNGRWEGALPVVFSIENPAAFGGPPDGGWAQTISQFGALTATAELTHEQNAWSLHNLQLSLAREGLSVRAAGVVHHLATGPAGHLYVLADADDDRYLRPLLGPDAPSITELELEAALAFGPGILTAGVDKLAGRMYGADWSVSGTIDELHRLRGMELTVVGHADSLRQLSLAGGQDGRTGGELPHAGPVNAYARLADDDTGELRLTDIHASVSDPRMSLQAIGEIVNFGKEMRGIFDVNLHLAGAEPLEPLLADSPAVTAFVQTAAPLEATGKLRTSATAGWMLDELKIRSLRPGMNVSAAGEITAFAPPEARLRLRAEDLDTAKLPTGKIPWPRDGELDLAFDLTASQGVVSLGNITAALESADTEMTARGDIDRLHPLLIRNLELGVKAGSVAALGWPYTGALNPANPVDGVIRVAATSTHGSRATLDVKIGVSDVRGEVKWQLPKDRQGVPQIPQIRAKLESERLDLVEMLAQPGKKTRFFSPAPIDTGWIHHIDGEIDLTAKTANNHILHLDDMNMRMVIGEGTLAQTVNGRMGAGEMGLTLAIDAGARPFFADFAMTGRQLDTTNLVALHKGDYLDRGTFDADIAFSAEGESVAGLAANADGYVTLKLESSRMKNQALDVIGGDIFSNLVTAINPFRSIGEYVEIECGVIHFDIEDGIATTEDGLAMKTDRVTVLGGGNIDLGDESMRILISPKARKGFGISPSSLASMVRLGGTLAEPKIEADTSRLWELGATALGAFYTGGLSFIAKGLLDRNRANADVCNLAAPPNIEQVDTGVSSVEGG